VRILKSRIRPQRHAQRFRGLIRFCRAQLRRPSRPHLTLCEVEDADAMPGVGDPGERSAARQFDVVTVGSDGENVYGCGHDVPSQ
jgi:hypothetical protein